MATLITGTDGLVQIGPSGSPTTIAFVKEFSVEAKTELTTRGPYIGDATIYKTRKAKTSSGSLSADVPAGRDSGQTAAMAAHEGATDIRLVLKADDSSGGYTYTAPIAAITGVKFEGKAEEGYSLSFDFEDLSGYTLVASS